jgi:hypothetical protein
VCMLGKSSTTELHPQTLALLRYGLTVGSHCVAKLILKSLCSPGWPLTHDPSASTPSVGISDVTTRLD